MRNKLGDPLHGRVCRQPTHLLSSALQELRMIRIVHGLLKFERHWWSWRCTGISASLATPTRISLLSCCLGDTDDGGTCGVRGGNRCGVGGGTGCSRSLTHTYAVVRATQTWNKRLKEIIMSVRCEVLKVCYMQQPSLSLAYKKKNLRHKDD